MDAPVHASGHVPHHPGIGVPEQELPGLRLLPGPVDVVENPADFRPRKVGGQGETNVRLEPVGALCTSKFVTDPVGAGVLPHDRVVHGFAGGAVPHDRGLTLVRDADRGDLVPVRARLCECLPDSLADVRPDFDRVVLDPACAREDLLVLELPDRDDLPGVVEQDRARGGGALVDGDYVLLLSHGCPFVTSS